MYCLPGSIERDIVIPAHPRYTRMYGVTNSIAFQALLHFRKLNFLIVNCLDMKFDSQNDESRREELIRMIEHSVQQLSLGELEALYYDMVAKDYIK